MLSGKKGFHRMGTNPYIHEEEETLLGDPGPFTYVVSAGKI